MRKIYEFIIRGRQRSTNAKIAEMLQRTEYRNESVQYVYTRLLELNE